MVGSSSSPVFPALVASLEQFRDRVADTPENIHRVALLAPGQPGTIVGVAIEILRVIRGLLVWLRDGLTALSRRLVSIDALLAVSDTLGALLEGIGDVLDPSVVSIPVAGLAEIQGSITGALGEVGSLLASAPLTELLPSPEDLAALETVLEDLVGSADGDPATGALDELLHDLATG